jgi:hypothetical protein
VDVVHLKDAFVWVCPHCDTRRVAHTVIRDVPANDVAPALRVTLGLPEFDDIDSSIIVTIQQSPSEVCCKGCNVVFAARFQKGRNLPTEADSSDD